MGNKQTYTYLDISGAGGATRCWRVPGLHCQNVARHCLPVQHSSGRDDSGGRVDREPVCWPDNNTIGDSSAESCVWLCGIDLVGQRKP